MAEEKPRIVPIPDGPLEVHGIEDLRNSRNEPVAHDEPMYLCRCGGSGNKPFCDGSHEQNGFKSARIAKAEQNKARDYVGRTVTVHDNRLFCSHATHCTHLSPGAFNVKARPWINPDGEAEARLIATVEACPSGALSYTKDGVLYRDDPGRKPALHIDRNGPYLVTGGPAIEAEIQPPSPEHYALCRCGKSRNLPYCDGSHWDVNFKDEKN
jgi:CDGSH-type Zn-finger protein